MSVPTALTRIIRRARGLLRHWSSDSDRAFHDQLFGAQSFDPFDPAYPGLLTIRRFADLAALRLPAAGLVLDLGCGTGEITCELARRRPDLRFLGVDHSAAAVERARGHARRLGLGHVRFEAADVARFEPPTPPSIVCFFDSFHHMEAPSALVRRLGDRCPRFLLVEPQGDWKGSWRRDLDFDWVVTEMDKVRARLAAALGEAPPGAAAPPAAAPAHDGAVEHRYSLDELHGFFDGFGVHVQGTVAGLETYPPHPYAHTASRAAFGTVEYELLKWIDEELHRRDLDLLARHWVVFAERGGRAPKRDLPAPGAVREAEGESVRGPYDVEIVEFDGPREAPPDHELRATVRLRNRSFRTWSSGGPAPIFLSYHWLDARGLMHTLDGKRSALPRPVGPGEECAVMLTVRTPAARGRGFLAVDLVEEGTSWFSDAGVPWTKVPFRWR